MALLPARVGEAAGATAAREARGGGDVDGAIEGLRAGEVGRPAVAALVALVGELVNPARVQAGLVVSGHVLREQRLGLGEERGDLRGILAAGDEGLGEQELDASLGRRLARTARARRRCVAAVSRSARRSAHEAWAIASHTRAAGVSLTGGRSQRRTRSWQSGTGRSVKRE